MKKILFLILLSLTTLACNERMYGVASSPRYKAVKPTSASLGYFNEDQFLKGEERIVIYSAVLSITVKNADSLNNKLGLLTKKYNGYAVSIGTNHSIIRVVSSKLPEALDEIKKLGVINRKSINGEDVTEQFTDYQLRLDNATKARERYLELLSKAENVEAALKVEKELERLNLDIESMKGKMEKLKHLSDYSTIEIDITERKKLGVVGAVGYGLFVAVKWLFVRN